jgi:DNA repair protein RecN (Recombination protein N)
MALKRIVLRDYVIVRELELDLGRGFTVLTGETGAGKSILIDALQLALGARADAGVVRTGASRAEVCAEFDTPAFLAPWLEALGFDTAPTLLLRRIIDTQGKSRAWINGSPATATQLRELGEQLLDIHGQHAWQSLTRANAVRQLLDAYAGNSLKKLSQCWLVWRDAHKQLHEAHAAQDGLQRERERLNWQIGEIGKLAPQEDEWEDINNQHARLSNAQALLDAANAALGGLESDESSAIVQLAHALEALRRQEHLEPQFHDFTEVLASSLAQAEDAAHSLHQYLRKTDLDPETLARLDERMGRWMSLARRYRRSPQELPSLLSSWKQELVKLDAATNLAALEQAEKRAQADYMAEAKIISKARIKAAPKLSQAVTQAMQDLGMQGGCFTVSVQALPELGQLGLDAVEFLVAGHAGHPPRPVGKVASGGELSRIALAIAVTTSQLGGAPTLIFDEVDSGIGGAVAETVGRLMRRLGTDRQVLAVTHLPQVAACADQHVVVSKQSKDGDTFSQLARVSGAQRVAEIARMLGGERLSDTTLAHAREMLATTGEIH